MTKVLETVKEIRAAAAAARKAGKKIGFIPTMGALHDGHLSLMRKAREETRFVIASVFVNPLQFGAGEDFDRYPRDLKADAAMCEAVGVDVIYSPSVAEMYPKGFKTFVDMEDLPTKLCGRFRPGHFRGVMTVVTKLLLMVTPDVAYFGQKDYQQALLLQRMTEDLNLPVRIQTLPIVREDDGLAMSSRNRYLSPAQRQDAVILHKALLYARRSIEKEGASSGPELVKEIEEMIRRVKGTKIDYVAMVHPETLEDVREIRGRVLVALAVRVGKTRLIDNDLIP